MLRNLFHLGCYNFDSRQLTQIHKLIGKQHTQSTNIFYTLRVQNVFLFSESEKVVLFLSPIVLCHVKQIQSNTIFNLFS